MTDTQSKLTSSELQTLTSALSILKRLEAEVLKDLQVTSWEDLRIYPMRAINLPKYCESMNDCLDAMSVFINHFDNDDHNSALEIV